MRLSKALGVYEQKRNNKAANISCVAGEPCPRKAIDSTSSICLQEYSIFGTFQALLCFCFIINLLFFFE